MQEVTYTLTMFDLAGEKVTGKLTYGIVDDKKVSNAGELTALADSTDTQVSVFTVKGKFTSADILGDEVCEVSGGMYVSLLGPPLTTILIGRCGKMVTMQFNLVDSQGRNIGGAMLVDNSHPRCFLGTRLE